MLKSVLVPLDGSPLAQMALDTAEQIVDPGCEITLLTVVQPLDFPITIAATVVVTNSDYAALEESKRESQKYLEGIAQGLRDRGFRARVRVETGDPAHVIAETTAALNVDMVIMTTHGRTGISRWLYGSVTARVLNLISKPVLVIPNVHRQDKLDPDPADMNSGS